jgi:hypothetical protein
MVVDAIVKLIVIVVWVGIAAALFAAPTWLLWNWLMPEILGLPRITLFQALGILLLSGMLFRSSVKFSTNDA